MPDNTAALEAFFASYWKQPHTFTYDETFPQQRKTYTKRLEQKYGRQTWSEYKKLESALHRTETDEDSLALCDFVYKHGMCEEIVPETTLRGRETLLSLLKYLSQRDKSFTLSELGSGCGKLTVGLAAGLDNLTAVYANEISLNGLQRIQTHIDELPAGIKEKTGKKIIPVHGDYRTEDVQKRLAGADVFLAAYPQYDSTVMIPNLARIAQGAEIILCYPFDSSTLATPFASWVNDEVAELHKDSYTEAAKQHGYSFTIIDVYGHLPWERLVIGSGKSSFPANNHSK